MGKGVHQGCILSPCLFNFYAEYIMQNAGLDEVEAGMKISGRNINNLRYADDITLMAENKELKSLLMKVKKESEKVDLKLNIQKTKIMASDPITSWQIDGETVTLCFFGLQNHCRWWLQPWNKKTFAPWKKSYEQPRQHIKKQRHYFTNKGLSSQSYGFSSSHAWMWELNYKESWVPKNWCFWTVVLEKTLESLLDCKEIKAVSPKGNQSWIFIGRTDAEAETPTLWPLDVKNWLIEKDPDAGKDWRQERRGNRGWDGWMVSPTQWTWFWASFRSWWWTGKPGVLQSIGSQIVRHNWVTELNGLKVPVICSDCDFIRFHAVLLRLFYLIILLSNK